VNPTYLISALIFCPRIPTHCAIVGLDSVEGFVMDNFCIDRGTLLDKPSVKTLEGPGQHTVHWYVSLQPPFVQQSSSNACVLVQSRGCAKLHGQRIYNLEGTSRWTVLGGLSTRHGGDRDSHQAWSANRCRLQHVHWQWETSARIARRSQGCRDSSGQWRSCADNQGNVGQSVEWVEWILQGERTRAETSRGTDSSTTERPRPTHSHLSNGTQRMLLPTFVKCLQQVH
jgi:hypothetical protein